MRHANIFTTMNIYTMALTSAKGKRKAWWSMYFWTVLGMSVKVLRRVQHKNNVRTTTACNLLILGASVATESTLEHC
jgi:hypothetical protein